MALSRLYTIKDINSDLGNHFSNEMSAFCVALEITYELRTEGLSSKCAVVDIILKSTSQYWGGGDSWNLFILVTFDVNLVLRSKIYYP